MRPFMLSIYYFHFNPTFFWPDWDRNVVYWNEFVVQSQCANHEIHLKKCFLYQICIQNLRFLQTVWFLLITAYINKRSHMDGAIETTDPVAHFPAYPLSCAYQTHLPQTRRVASGELAFPVFWAQRLHGVLPQSTHRVHISAPERKEHTHIYRCE